MKNDIFDKIPPEFKDWAADVPGESFSYIFNEWGRMMNGQKKTKNNK